MTTNRSMPPGTFIPELAYADVGAAAAWLRDSFGFGGINRGAATAPLAAESTAG